MFNKTVALLGFLCLIWASFIFIISKILANKAPSYIEYNDGSSSRDYNIKTYYWRGAIVSINKQEMIAGIITVSCIKPSHAYLGPYQLSTIELKVVNYFPPKVLHKCLTGS